MARTYGRLRARGGSRTLEAAVELSPVKSLCLSCEEPSAVETSTAPRQEKEMAARDVTTKNEECEDEKEYVYDLKKNTGEIRTRSMKRNRTHHAMQKEKDIASVQLSNYVHSTTNLSRSPTPTSYLSPLRVSRSNASTPKVERTLSGTLQRASTTPPRYKLARKKPKQMEKLDEGWSLISNLSEISPKKTTLAFSKAVLERETTQSSITQDSGMNSFMKLLTDSDLERKTEKNSEAKSPIQRSPKIRRASRIYGDHYSYRVRQDTVDPPYEKDDDETTSDATRSLKTMSDLKLQGEHAKFVDELNFILEGIESGSQLSGLLELALRLSDDEFLQLTRQFGFSPVQKYIDITNPLQNFLLAYVLCKISENLKDTITFDGDLINLAVELLRTDVLNTKQLSKTNKELFSELLKEVGGNDDPQFIAITLLFQNNLFFNKELFKTGLKPFKLLLNQRLINTISLKKLHMLIILYESFIQMENFEIECLSDTSFAELIPPLINIETTDRNCNLCILKLLIVLSMKKFNPVLRFKNLVTKTITKIWLASEAHDAETCLLNLGLLINLIEERKCLEEVTETSNISKLYDIFSSVRNSCSISYFALLLGTIFIRSPESFTDKFKYKDLRRIQVNLQKFENSDDKNFTKFQANRIISEMEDLM